MKWVFLALSLLSETPLAGQGYGEALAVGGGDVVVGEPLDETSPGYVYVYRKDSGGAWVEVQRLEASNSAIGDHFGRTVTLSGDQLLVGSTLLQAIYVFEKDGSDQWRETQILTASDTFEGNFIGRISAADGDHFFASSWADSEGRGAVYVFERDPATGQWNETDKLMGSDVGPNEVFGMSIAVEGDLALIGTAQKDNGTGAAYVFRRDAATGDWSEQSKLTGPGTGPNSAFGITVGLDGGVALVAAAFHDVGRGVVFEFSYDESTGEWQTGPTLRTFDGGNPGIQLGITMHFSGGEAWFGAPGASEFEGRVYLMYRSPSGEWIGASKLTAADLAPREQFGTTLAVQDDVAAVRVLLDDYELGSVAIFERQSGVWSQAGKVFREPPATFASIIGGQVDCEGGAADAFSCNDLDLLSFLSLADLGGGATGRQRERPLGMDRPRLGSGIRARGTLRRHLLRRRQRPPESQVRGRPPDNRGCHGGPLEGHQGLPRPCLHRSRWLRCPWDADLRPHQTSGRAGGPGDLRGGRSLQPDRKRPQYRDQRGDRLRLRGGSQ